MSCCGYIGDTLQATANNIADFFNFDHAKDAESLAERIASGVFTKLFSTINHHTKGKVCYYTMTHRGVLFGGVQSNKPSSVAGWFALLDAYMMNKPEVKASVCAGYDKINERFYFGVSFQ